MERTRVVILGISELKWTEMIHFQSDEYKVFFCHQDHVRRNGVTMPGADCGTDHELLVATIQVKLKKSKKSEIENRYNLCDIPERYAVEVKNRFAELDLIDREPEELWQEVEAIVNDEAKDNIPKARKPKKSKWLTKVAIDIADKRREAKKGQAHPDEVRKLNAKFQRQARKDKEDDLNRACKEIEDENRKGKTRDLFKKIQEITGKYKPRIGGIKSTSGNDFSEEGHVKQGWRHYTENLYNRDDNMTTIIRDKGM